jgi:glutamate racemase
MSDPRPIGVFDSGVGGLTVLTALQERLPSESTIYLGDLARLPYGPRPQEQVREFAIQVTDFLATEGIKLLVVACNTATAAAYARLRDRYDFPVVGVISPGAAEAVRLTRTGRIGVVATDGTVASGAYSDAVRALLPAAHVLERPASWLVPLVEAGHACDDRIEAGLVPIMADFHAHRIDTLILGCTHFPLVRDIFERVAGPEVRVVDSATTTAREVERQVLERAMASDGPPAHRFLVTGPSSSFATRADAMFHTSPPIETVDLQSAVVRSA